MCCSNFLWTSLRNVRYPVGEGDDKPFFEQPPGGKAFLRLLLIRATVTTEAVATTPQLLNCPNASAVEL
jgi:hypothetical protein